MSVNDHVLLVGTAVSPGVAQGAAYVLEGTGDGTPVPVRKIGTAEIEDELGRLEAAITQAERELLALQESVAQNVGAAESEIFGAHAMLVRSPSLHRKVVALVREKQLNAEAAVAEVIEELTRAFDEIRDDALRQRRVDIRDIGRRMLAALLDDQEGPCGDIPEGAILVAGDLTPSLTANLDVCSVRGLVTERGGRFAHAAILARSAGTPAVSGIRHATSTIRTGDRLVVDGISGEVLVNPGLPLQRRFRRVEAELRTFREELEQLIHEPSVTLDGTRVVLLANVASVAEAETALLYRAEGIGLYRTEVGFGAATRFPSEEEQYDLLADVAARMRPNRVVLRLLDVGGDKQLDYWALPAARNPALARRGIRLLLAHPEVLLRQLRVFLRLSADHDVCILVPGVGGVEDMRETRKAIRRVQADLAADGLAFDPGVQVGAMIELPCAALLTAGLLKEVDFVSLGTNDLVQYLLAADRDDEDSASNYQPLHPAVLGLVRKVASEAAAAGKPFGICGEIGGDPVHTELLVGLGFRELSVAPANMLAVRHAIRMIRLPEAEAVARHALSLGSTAEIEALLADRATRLLPAVLRSRVGRAAADAA